MGHRTLQYGSGLGMPVIGICLGMQLMAIARGTPLIQDNGSSVEALFFTMVPLHSRFFMMSPSEKTVCNSALGGSHWFPPSTTRHLSPFPPGFQLQR